MKKILFIAFFAILPSLLSAEEMPFNASASISKLSENKVLLKVDYSK